MPQFPYIKTIYEKDELNNSSTNIEAINETLPNVQTQIKNQPLSISTGAAPYNNTLAMPQNQVYQSNVDQSQYQQAYNIPSCQPTEQVQYYSYPPAMQNRPILPLQVPGMVDLTQSSNRDSSVFASQNSSEYSNGMIPSMYQRGIYAPPVYYPPNHRQQSVVQSGPSYSEVYYQDINNAKPLRSQTPGPVKTASALMLSAPQRPSSTQAHRPIDLSLVNAAVPFNSTNRRNHGGVHKTSMIDAATYRNIKLDYSKVSKLAYDISEKMIIPPFKNQKPNKSAFIPEKPKRSRRKSKFTPEQDKLIVQLKSENKSWVEIAEIAKVESYLTARNRYQVLIGQQGSSSHDFTEQDLFTLKEIVDEAEIEKMKHLSKEFRKCTGKLCTYKQVRELIRYMFWKDPEQFDVGPSYLMELDRLQKLREEELAKEDMELADNSQMENKELKEVDPKQEHSV